MQQTHEPLTIAKEFRRATGAHAIITSLLLADLAGLLLWLLIGAFAGPPLWWLIRFCVFVLHKSLGLSIGLVLILFCLAIGMIQQRLMKKKTEDAWAAPALIIALIITVFILLTLVKTAWVRIPAPVIPNLTLEMVPWLFSFTPVGAELAVGLSLLAHLVLLRRSHAQLEPGGRSLSLSRAHPGGSHWTWIHKCYTFHMRGFTRFESPPVKHFKAPPTFFYYTPESPEADPERGLFWASQALIIAETLFGPEQANVLLPLLARSLHDYNSPNLRVEQLLQLAHLTEENAFTAWMLLIPLLISFACERRWQALEKDRVLDRDRFAYWCGEAVRLQKLLRLLLERRRKSGQPDDSVPTLSERIEHLEGLLKYEARQVKKLRAALPPCTTSGFLTAR